MVETMSGDRVAVECAALAVGILRQESERRGLLYDDRPELAERALARSDVAGACDIVQEMLALPVASTANCWREKDVLRAMQMACDHARGVASRTATALGVGLTAFTDAVGDADRASLAGLVETAFAPSVMTWFIGPIEQRMRWVPPGRFTMGSPKGEARRRGNEGPPHDVTLREGFWLGATTMTQALWEAVMGSNPSHRTGADLPVASVSWKDCHAFLKKLNAEVPGLCARLPREAEWEHACRAGTSTATWLGSNDSAVLNRIAWWTENSGDRANPVGKKEPNPFGLYDMLGNVWEWCEDRFGMYSAVAAVDPRGSASGSGRVLRGGGWNDSVQLVRAACRHAYDPGIRLPNLSLRLARDQQ